jgi:glutamyl-tRNA reductase
MTVPVAMVGFDFREAPSAIRHRLVELDNDTVGGPSARLRQQGQCAGIVRIESCSRVEWVLSAANPTWAAELFRSALTRALGSGAVGRKPHLKVSSGALDYLMRVSLGLESVAEGEHAIGRQVLRAFAQARESEATDRVLHLCWTAVGKVLQARKSVGGNASVGVQSLVVAALKALPLHARVAVLGQGEIGRQVSQALARAGFRDVVSHSRQTLEQFHLNALTAAAVVVCTAGPTAWVKLPARENAPTVIDVGVPGQIESASGWQHVALDSLLEQRGLLLDAPALQTLESLAAEGADGLRAALEATATHHVLEAIDNEKKRFLSEEVESVLAALPPREARHVTEALREFTHRLMAVTRKAGHVS